MRHPFRSLLSGSLLALPLLMHTSCASQFNVDGNSDLAKLDGQVLYLRPLGSTSALSCLDSCQVVHGRFNFGGEVDSIMFAEVYMGQERVMPLVVEGADLSINLDAMGQIVEGGKLNDQLYDFLNEMAQFENEMCELEFKSMRLFHQGMPIQEAMSQTSDEVRKLKHKSEKREEDFVLKNSDNALGIGYFISLCESQPFLTNHMRRIVDRAPASFLSHPFISTYLHQMGYTPAKKGKKKK